MCETATALQTIGALDRRASLKILVVDDLEAVVTMLQDGLAEAGHRVYTAYSGTEAVEIFARTPVDAVICDLAMPHMNGFTVGKAVRAICRERGVPKTPFILFTGCGPEVERDHRLAECGVDIVLHKPTNLEHLIDAVTELVSAYRPSWP